MLDPKQLDALLHPQFDPEALKAAKPGFRSGRFPGAACGKIVFTAEDAVEQGQAGEKVVLVRLEPLPGHRGHAVCPGHPRRRAAR
ncbi:MAG: hypothetical protein ACLRSY_00080 [Acutalibacter sp.]